MSHDVYDLPPSYLNSDEILYDMPADLDPLEQLIREEEEAEEREEEETWKERQSDR